MIDRPRPAATDADQARLDLALGHREQGQDQTAYDLLVALARDRSRVLGPDHPDTLTARYEAAVSCYHLHLLVADPDPARLPEAVTRLEEVAADRERLFGPAHRDTLRTWLTLSAAYAEAGRYAEAEALDERLTAGWERAVAERERADGPDAAETQYARVNLASQYFAAGRSDEKRALHEQVAASWGRLAAQLATSRGPVHPDTVEAREQHAYAHRAIGRPAEEVRLVEEIAADHVRLLGPDHPHTLRARVRLAARYNEGGHDPAAALALAEQIIDAVARVHGPEDSLLRLVQAVLASSYHQAGRDDDVRALFARYPIPDEEMSS